MTQEGARPRKGIALVGFMASGKTSVGERLAAILGWEFADTDAEIERAAGSDVSGIFGREGEPGFRIRETAALYSLCGRDSVVVSTGGGAVLAEANRNLLRERCYSVWLVVPPEEAVRRAALSGSVRPLLAAGDPLDRARTLLAQRVALYREVAAFTVDTAGRAPADIAEEIHGHYARTL